MEWLDWSWWPYLEVPFSVRGGGFVMDFTPVDTFLRMVFSVGPLLVFVAVFLMVRRILVSFSGGD